MLGNFVSETRLRNMLVDHYFRKYSKKLVVYSYKVVLANSYTAPKYKKLDVILNIMFEIINEKHVRELLFY